MRSAATASLPESGATGSTCTVGDMSIDRIVPESSSRWLVDSCVLENGLVFELMLYNYSSGVLNGDPRPIHVSIRNSPLSLSALVRESL